MGGEMNDPDDGGAHPGAFAPAPLGEGGFVVVERDEVAVAGDDFDVVPEATGSVNEQGEAGAAIGTASVPFVPEAFQAIGSSLSAGARSSTRLSSSSSSSSSSSASRQAVAPRAAAAAVRAPSSLTSSTASIVEPDSVDEIDPAVADPAAGDGDDDPVPRFDIASAALAVWEAVYEFFYAYAIVVYHEAMALLEKLYALAGATRQAWDARGPLPPSVKRAVRHKLFPLLLALVLSLLVVLPAYYLVPRGGQPRLSARQWQARYEDLSSKHSAAVVRSRLKYDNLAGRHVELQAEYEAVVDDLKKQAPPGTDEACHGGSETYPDSCVQDAGPIAMARDALLMAEQAASEMFKHFSDGLREDAHEIAELLRRYRDDRYSDGNGNGSGDGTGEAGKEEKREAKEEEEEACGLGGDGGGKCHSDKIKGGKADKAAAKKKAKLEKKEEKKRTKMREQEEREAAKAAVVEGRAPAHVDGGGDGGEGGGGVDGGGDSVGDGGGGGGDSVGGGDGGGDDVGNGSIRKRENKEAKKKKEKKEKKKAKVPGLEERGAVAAVAKSGEHALGDGGGGGGGSTDKKEGKESMNKNEEKEKKKKKKKKSAKVKNFKERNMQERDVVVAAVAEARARAGSGGNGVGVGNGKAATNENAEEEKEETKMTRLEQREADKAKVNKARAISRAHVRAHARGGVGDVSAPTARPLGVKPNARVPEASSERNGNAKNGGTIEFRKPPRAGDALAPAARPRAKAKKDKKKPAAPKKSKKLEKQAKGEVETRKGGTGAGGKMEKEDRKQRASAGGEGGDGKTTVDSARAGGGKGPRGNVAQTPQDQNVRLSSDSRVTKRAAPDDEKPVDASPKRAQNAQNNDDNNEVKNSPKSRPKYAPDNNRKNGPKNDSKNDSKNTPKSQPKSTSQRKSKPKNKNKPKKTDKGDRVHQNKRSNNNHSQVRVPQGPSPRPGSCKGTAGRVIPRGEDGKGSAKSLERNGPGASKARQIVERSKVPAATAAGGGGCGEKRTDEL